MWKLVIASLSLWWGQCIQYPFHPKFLTLCLLLRWHNIEFIILCICTATVAHRNEAWGAWLSFIWGKWNVYIVTVGTVQNGQKIICKPVKLNSGSTDATSISLVSFGFRFKLVDKLHRTLSSQVWVIFVPTSPKVEKNPQRLCSCRGFSLCSKYDFGTLWQYSARACQILFYYLEMLMFNQVIFLHLVFVSHIIPSPGTDQLVANRQSLHTFIVLWSSLFGWERTLWC